MNRNQKHIYKDMKVKGKQLIIMLLVLGMILLAISHIFSESGEKTLETSANADSPYHILVDVEESRLYVLKDGACIKTYRCSGGKYTTPSPIGTWTIISKAKWGEGFGR